MSSNNLNKIKNKIMENIERKFETRKFKAEIKVLAGYQVFLKNQRKTVKLQGKKEMEPWVATMKHYHNRQDLAAMYVAYGVMRGKDLEEQMKAHVRLEMDWDEESYKTKVNNLLKEYRIKETVLEDE